MIAAYFNDATIKACGICDNCIAQANLVVSIEDFEKISGKILQLINEEPIKSKELIKKLPGINKAKLWKVTDYLLAENKIKVTEKGEIKKI